MVMVWGSAHRKRVGMCALVGCRWTLDEGPHGNGGIGDYDRGLMTRCPVAAATAKRRHEIVVRSGPIEQCSVLMTARTGCGAHVRVGTCLGSRGTHAMSVAVSSGRRRK